MKRYLLAAAVAAFAAAMLTTGALAGGGTGITATPAATKTFDGGNTSATFVRAASGIINETNRVGLNGTPQNPWSPFDVRIQFRPLTGPLGIGSPTPNPACDQAGLVTSFHWSNGDNGIGGTATGGYFIGSNPYNVCVYYAHPFVLTLLGNGATSLDVNVGDHVVYTGHYSNGSVPIAGAPVALDVFTGFGCTTPLYAGISAGLTDGAGNYSFDGGPSPFGAYSVRGSTANATSNCIDIAVAHVYGVDLAVTPNPVPQGNDVVFTSHLRQDGVIDSTDAATVTVIAYDTDSTCTTPAGYGPFPTSLVTDTYTTAALGATAPPANYYYRAQAVGAFGTVTSGCTALTIIAPHNYNLTLLANGETSISVASGDPITYSGVFTDYGVGQSGAPVSLSVFTGFGCSGLLLVTLPAGTTGVTGAYSLGPDSDTVAGPKGEFSLNATTGTTTSNCVSVTVS